VDAALTLKEAATLLQPPLTEQQLRAIIRALHWQPAGWRHNPCGHPWATYPWTDISALHKDLLPHMRGSQLR
jgi:hypothetical protein